jgi:hypothetical protein
MRQCYLLPKHLPDLRANLNKVCLIIIASILIFPLYTNFSVEASSNAHLFVSAENSLFENHFEGSMIIEVVVREPDLNDIDEAVGEPNVKINGNTLRMAQANDGNWYAYFANVNKAKIADQIVHSVGGAADGLSLDFGVFCNKNTPSSILGVSFSDTEGIAVPRSGTLTGFTNGNSGFSTCGGSPSGPNLNNVVRSPRSLNINPAVQPGQIGLDIDAWPIIQLYSFNDVEIQYSRPGGTESVELDYNEIPNVSLNLDRRGYPNNAEVFATINDIQLNQDPTDEDSWTFNINSPKTSFYQAYDSSGTDSGNNSPGLINLAPHLSNLGFEDNGALTLSLGNVVKLKTNNNQPDMSVFDGTTTYSQIVTFVESSRNSGIFESFDNNNESTIGILGNAPRGQTGVITYNDVSTTILAGSSTASLDLGINGAQFSAGQEATVTLVDSDQNVNSGSVDELDIFRSSAIIPTLELGKPFTLESTSGVKFFTTSSDPLGGLGIPMIFFTVPDKNSDRLILDTTSAGITAFETVTINSGKTAADLQSLFVDNSIGSNDGTNWINFDLRSFEKQLGVSSFSDTNMTLHFGALPGITKIQILDPGDISSGQGLIQIDDADITAINSVSGSSSVFLSINFDSSENTVGAGMISSETNTQPIVIDFFSFGEKNNKKVNNAIYRFELKETAKNSGIFTGSVEYSLIRELKSDPNLILTLRTIDDRIRFLATDRLIDEEGINISYSDIAEVGVTIATSTKSEIRTNSGSVSTTSSSYRFGQPVFFVLNDPDLNAKHDEIESFRVIDDPMSLNVDTVGTVGGDILLEILIKDFRFMRCTINGIEYGGLAATGFTLTETESNSGIFEGSFKMPSQICDKSGTKLISTAGGSLDAKYYDFRDSSGEQNIFGLSNLALKGGTPPILNSDKFVIPNYQKTAEVILNGKVGDYIQGTTIDIVLKGPDLSSEEFKVFATKNGEYKVIFTLYHYSKSGNYQINVKYRGSNVGDVSFQLSKHLVPDWIKNNAKWWSAEQITDSEFITGVEHLIDKKIIIIPNTKLLENSGQNIPIWIKNTAEWWSLDLVSDDEFVAALEFLVNNGIIRI